MPMSISMASSLLPLHPSTPSPHPNHQFSLPQPQECLSPTHPNLTIRARLSQLCKDGRPDLARRLFDNLPRPSPTILWNTLLIGFVCNAMPEEALRFYALMNSSRGAPEPDHYTYSSALKACADARMLRAGKSVHCRIVRRLPRIKNRVLNNSLLNMYASCLDDPRAGVVEKMFERMPKRNVVSWNTVVAWFVKTLQPLDALRKFKLMMEEGIKPTTVSFVNVFPAVTGIGDKKIADVLYGLLFKLESESVNDLFIVSAAIFMYSELSDIECARRVFDRAVERNIEVWNTMIGGYVQNDLPEEALVLFVQILESDEVVIDTVTLVVALMAVSQSQVVQFGQQIHAYLVKKKNSSTLPVILMNALMVMYSRCDCITEAFEVFHQMKERDIVSWNTMVSAFVQNGMNFEGLLLVYEMQKERYEIDSVTVTALLSAASNLGDIRIGKETHGYLIRHGIQCPGMNSYLIDMYSKSGFVETARRQFDADQSRERDQVTWNALIAGYTQSGQTEQSIKVFRQMLEENQRPNAVTLSSVLPACSPVGGIQLGKQIHGFSLRHSLDRNVFVGTALVDMYSKCGNISYAERLFDGMPDRNSVTYTTMISGFGQHGLGERALSLFRFLQESGMKPDGITFVAILSACSYSGMVDEGLEIFNSMESVLGIPPTPEHHGCVVDMLGRSGRVEQAYEFVCELGDKGDVVGIWGSLLAACKMHGKFELGKVVAERLFEIEREGGLAGYRVLLSNVYAAERKWDNVDRIRKEMREKGLSKEPGSSWIEVGNAAHQFMSKDQSHPEHDQIQGILEDLAAEMKISGYKPILSDLIDGGRE